MGSPREALKTSAPVRKTAANRGYLCARQFADLRKAACIVREDGVCLLLHGVALSPATSQAGSWLKVARKNQTNVHDVGRGQMTSETGVAVHVKSSKEQQRAERGARRLQEFQEGKRAEQCTAHWLPFIRRVYY